ncbi:MAG: ABC transporter permease [Thermoleophilia bacterium]|jgi:ABC-2 type transport system permease protein|nr:ABC transporter permease [Thermoleophilia bacterium]
MRALRNALLLLGKDLRLIRRSPALVAVLVGYPVVVAVLVALALQGGERKPTVAFVNLDTTGRTVQVGEQRLSVDDYVARLEREVDLKRLGPDEARRALDDGQVTAVLTLPDGFVSDLQSGVRSPVISLVTSPRQPIEAEAIQRRLESTVYRLNQELAETYVGQVLRLVDLIDQGGSIALFGRTGDLVGLGRSDEILTELQRELGRIGRPDLVRKIEPLRAYIEGVGENLDLARPAANAIASPIKLSVSEGPEGREPLSAFGFAGALLVSLGLVGVLLAAAALSSEREDNALVRLARGLLSPGALVGEKTVFAALACLVVGAVLLVIVALTTTLAVGRWGLWVVALLLSGLGFGAFGVLVGALARETRTALLAGLMLALPLIFLGLVPGNDAAALVSGLTAFGPAFAAYQTLLVEPSVPGDLWVTFGHLALVALVFSGAAGWALHRRAHQ